MKQFYFRTVLAILLTAPLATFAQSTSKTVLGSFIYKNKVYNLEFVQLSTSSYQLNINGFPTNAKASQTPEVKPVTDSTKNKKTVKPVTDTTKNKNAVKPVTDTTKNKNAASDKNITQKSADTSNGVQEKDYIFSELSLEVFKTAFITQMHDKFQAKKDDDTLKNLAISKFTFVNDNLGFQDDEPVTAYFRLQSDSVVSILKSNASSYYNSGLSHIIIKNKIDHVDIETQDGAIKNIQVYLIYNHTANKDKQVDPTRGPVFKNQFPISISSKFDPERFADIDLYSFNCNGVQGLTRYVKLSDVLEMRLVLANNKEDYSPSDRVVTLSPTLPTIELKKEKRSRILEVNAFTDFVGLDQEQPNGLIQIEAKRKINLFTHSWPFFALKENNNIAANYNLNDYYISTERLEGGKSTKYILIPKKTTVIDSTTGVVTTFSRDTIIYKNEKLTSGYLSIFSYIEPRLLFSKLDGNNRYYLLDTPAFTSKKLNPLRNYQYQLASFGFDLNLVKFSFPDVKFSWNVLDAGVYWYRSRVQATWDTVSKHSTPLNNGILNLSTHIDFHSDSRWGAGFMFGHVWQHLWSDIYKLPVQAGLWQVGFDGFLVTNDVDNSKIFFRFRWTGNAHHFDTNFTQIQMGYSVNIFAASSQQKK
jgi:hypothetical protein